MLACTVGTWDFFLKHVFLSYYSSIKSKTRKKKGIIMNNNNKILFTSLKLTGMDKGHEAGKKRPRS